MGSEVEEWRPGEPKTVSLESFARGNRLKQSGNQF